MNDGILANETDEYRIEFMHMVPRRQIRLFAITAISFAMSFAGSVATGQDIKIERIDLGVAAPERSIVRIGSFNPIRVDIKNGPESFTGEIQFVTDDPDGVEVVFSTPVRLTPGQVTTVSGLVAPGQLLPRIQARVVNEQGRSIGIAREASIDGLSVLEASIRTVGVLGTASGIEQLTGVPGLTNVTRSSRKDIEVIRLTPDRFPARAEALESLDTLVIDTSDVAVLNILDAGRSGALKNWVANGGHLVIVAAAQSQTLLDSSLKEILPAVPSGSVRSFDLGALESLVGSTNPLVGAGRAMTVTRFEELSERSGMAVDTASSSPVIVRGSSGFGRVTLIGFDVHDGPFATWKDRPLFWVKALDLRRAVTDTSAGAASNAPLNAGGSFFRSTASDLAGIMRSALDQFAGLRVVGFGLVVSLIIAYLLAIGPGDYLLVRYGFRRPEWTWLTFPVIVLVVTSGAYLMSYRMKGRDLRINKVDILDLDYVHKMSRGTTIAAVFSPNNQDYDLTQSPATSKNRESVVSEVPESTKDFKFRKLNWYDSPDDTLGGSARPSTLSLTSSNYRYGGTDGTSALMGLRIPIWSTRTIAGQWLGQDLTLNPVRSDLARTGTDRVTGRVTNLLDEPLTDAILVYQTQVYDLGTIAPGASVTINPSRTQNLTGYLDRFGSDQFQNEGPGWATSARSRIPRLMMFHDSGPTTLRSITNGPMNRLDLTGLLALNRPMLVAKIERPGSVLTLAGVKNLDQAVIDQTTLLRCVLPLSATSTAAAPGQNQEFSVTSATGRRPVSGH
jgi:hypothetical protein